MARTSKRKVRLESQLLQKNVPVQTYMAGIYARLSVDHQDGKEVSIENQIEMAKEYLKSHAEITLYDCYSDLGATGTNFERRGFERLMQDVRDGLVNCVIVKDFSRFGRNYIETGNFVEKIFPFLGVRFIAITDQYDSSKPLSCNEMLSVHLKNIANELYARDISEKVTASKWLKREQGEYIGGLPPYGYMVEKRNGKRILLPEPVTGEIVKQLFEYYDSGETFGALVRWLYEQKIHRPGDYKKYQTVYQKEGQKLSQWGRDSIRFLLTNVVYVDTREPLVSDELFYRVRKRIEENRKIQNRRLLGKDTMGDIFRGVLYCGECGHITSLQLQKIIFQTLKKEFALSDIQMKKLTTFHKEQAEKRKMQIRKAQSDLQKSVENTEVQMSFCYLEYRNGRITQTQFLEEKKKLEEKRTQDQQELKDLHIKYLTVDREAEKQKQWIRTVVKCQKQANLTAELVQNLIERIDVYENRRIKITWKWRDGVGEVLGGICGEK